MTQPQNTQPEWTKNNDEKIPSPPKLTRQYAVAKTPPKKKKSQKKVKKDKSRNKSGGYFKKKRKTNISRRRKNIRFSPIMG